MYGDRPGSGPRGHQSVETGTGGGLYHHPPTEQVGSLSIYSTCIRFNCTCNIYTATCKSLIALAGSKSTYSFMSITGS